MEMNTPQDPEKINCEAREIDQVSKFVTKFENDPLAPDVLVFNAS
jgi:hypothetical protein